MSNVVNLHPTAEDTLEMLRKEMPDAEKFVMIAFHPVNEDDFTLVYKCSRAQMALAAARMLAKAGEST